jgi:hypothetical protein
MTKRKLRIIRKQSSMIGVCELCKVQFKADPPYPYANTAHFEVHNCEPTDGSQNELHIVLDATDDN